MSDWNLLELYARGFFKENKAIAIDYAITQILQIDYPKGANAGKRLEEEWQTFQNRVECHFFEISTHNLTLLQDYLERHELHRKSHYITGIITRLELVRHAENGKIFQEKKNPTAAIQELQKARGYAYAALCCVKNPKTITSTHIGIVQLLVAEAFCWIDLQNAENAENRLDECDIKLGFINTSWSALPELSKSYQEARELLELTQ